MKIFKGLSMLSQDELNKIFVYKNGMLFKILKKTGKVSIFRSGTYKPKLGYRVIGIKGKYYREHRIIYILKKGTIPKGYFIDHKDNNPLNNKISNLRVCVHAQNVQNQISKRNKSGYRGVAPVSKNSWRYSICAFGVKYYKFGFKTALEAHNARNKISLKLHGRFSNFKSNNS